MRSAFGWKVVGGLLLAAGVSPFACSSETKKTGEPLVTPGGSGGAGGEQQTSGAGGSSTSGSAAGGSPAADCGPCDEGKLCDAALGCVDCVTSADCPNLTASFCVLGSCRECATAADCAANEVCTPGSFKCSLPCTADADCTDYQASLCDEASGTCVECIGAGDCPMTPALCSPLTGKCVDCVGAGDCGAAAPGCNVSGQCVPCTVNAHCGAGSVCVEQQCRDACTSDADCSGDEPVCELGGGYCVQCGSDRDCTGAAGQPACSADFTCVQCVKDSHCPDPAEPVCTSYNSCVECVDDADCAGKAETPLCGYSSACVQCKQDTDCAVGQTCVDYACSP